MIKKQDMTLEEVFQFVEAKEAGRRSASCLFDGESVNLASTYKKAKQDSNKVDTELCSYCGTRGHVKQSTARIHRTECPAFGHKDVTTASVTIILNPCVVARTTSSPHHVPDSPDLQIMNMQCLMLYAHYLMIMYGLIWMAVSMTICAQYTRVLMAIMNTLIQTAV